ncbi:MAG: FGGY family carbohydrate kinase [Bacteroidota bacterium]
MYLLGYDIGSSSIKAALVEAGSGNTVGIAQYPEREMEIISEEVGWAEQRPELWWEHLGSATKKLLSKTSVDPKEIKGIGISYQMHGLVLLDKNGEVIRPAIIWCDSRATTYGDQAFSAIGEKKCLDHLLNAPGNFTAAKLKWVKENEPERYDQIDKIMLPGDYIAFKMTGEVRTTVSGLSEGMFWDFQEDGLAHFLMDHFAFDEELVPEVVDTFSNQGVLHQEAAGFLNLPVGTPVGYRAGDQPNNALSLNVINPGEVAATGGTSGVVYGVVDQPLMDEQMRINSFAHVNHTKEDPRIGVLLCVNGAGIQYSWMKQMLSEDGTGYDELERLAASVPVNSDGLRVIPFGNGAERILQNRNLGAHVMNLQFNRHGKAHLYRAALEGIAFSFIYGIEMMKEMGVKLDRMKVGNDNLFQSEVFSSTICGVLGCEIEMMNTTGAVGAAKAAGVGVGIYPSIADAFQTMHPIKTYHYPGSQSESVEGYQKWKTDLTSII